MGMEQATAATLPTSSSAQDAGLTLAGLIDVLDRADEVLVRRRARPRRSAVYRSTGYRSAAYRPAGSRPVADRWDPMRTMEPRTAARPVRPGSPRPVPLRSVQPAPAARPPLTSTAPRPAPVPAPRPAASVPRNAGTAPGRLRALLRDFNRRVALWGAGPDGAYLAWGGSTPRPAYRAGAQPVDPPVVLRELPSTPTIRPATPSPVAALRPAAPFSPPRERPPAPPAAPASRHLLGRLPASSPGTSSTAATGLPESRARAPAGIRGSPGAPLARGSPPGWPDTG